MKIDVLSLFPDMFTGVFEQSILKKAKEKGVASYKVTNFRDFADNKHNKVDDYPYGGGAGMVLMPQPIFDAVDSLKQQVAPEAKPPRIILMTPQGDRYTQRHAEELAKEDHLIFLCGHYEGYDERIREQLVTDELSIGDYVLTGGELAAMVIIDSVVRLLPGALGNDVSAVTDSFSSGLLEHPQYTRPANFRGFKVPDVLLSGNHAKIEEWRKAESLRRTRERRPDLLEAYKEKPE
ncbi:tRNA (guanosine(37)-N1)-methyltransferase TrmD [Pullulanibacillus sp. KACC 23026]|uniref:tRNA (guanosine(37)-N1)-methyltransferase TrmD n=1 Tax=Pullulanibacillus sp. KACC 23026 TaxID=3028315 RepID=UPI0023B04531|nr:tRNA (guanosine(37)-N1)-methyltransferase TrmD [Pullulanibacillus sp. KACC 23026]WEG11606.1 tRNA (guanosine(37)-N1)-methyltransferase TrmD [Pullulanibacillus sp. KACC 23026]